MLPMYVLIFIDCDISYEVAFLYKIKDKIEKYPNLVC